MNHNLEETGIAPAFIRRLPENMHELLLREPTIAMNVPIFESDVVGGTHDQGIKVASAILGRVERNEPLTHPLIIEGHKGLIGSKIQIFAASTPLNMGLMEGFGLDPEVLKEIYGGNTIELGKLGLNTTFENVWKPVDDLSETEIEGMKRKLRDASGNKLFKEGGISVFPKFALRATLQSL
jgi:hypothetical protein